MFGINKYIVGAVAMLVVLTGTFLFGYFSHDVKEKVQVVPPKCSEFRKYVVTGAETDKVIEKFRLHKLCAA